MTVGMNRHNGEAISDTAGGPAGGQAHLAQSILDILTTPVGTRVMLRDYGCELPAILDQPMNGEMLVDATMAVAEALDRWEPRIELARVRLVDVAAGQAQFELIDSDGKMLPIALAVAGGAT